VTGIERPPPGVLLFAGVDEQIKKSLLVLRGEQGRVNRSRMKKLLELICHPPPLSRQPNRTAVSGRVDIRCDKYTCQ